MKKIYLNLSRQSSEGFKQLVECSIHPSSLTLPVNVAVDQHPNPDKLLIEEDCGREETPDSVVALFDDIFIGVIYKDSTS